MPQKNRRYTLKTKESKQILAQASHRLKFDLEALYGSKANIELVEFENENLILVGGKPKLFKANDAVFPALTATEIVAKLPKAVVDMGAVRFVCNGADIMARGIVNYEGTFAKGDIIVVVDVTHNKPLALGEALYSSEEARVIRQGPAIKSRHYVGDKVWNAAKTISE